MAVEDWPQGATHELRRTVYQQRRIYSGDLTEPVVFGDRPLWNATLDWGYQSKAKAEDIAGRIAEVAHVESDWRLYLDGDHRQGNALTSTWGVQVESYDADAGTITFKGAAQSSRGHLFQVGRYVLRVLKVAGAVVTVENFPEAIDGLSASARNALVFGWDRDNLVNPLMIKARVLDGQSPAVEKISNNVSRVLPVTIVEVA